MADDFTEELTGDLTAWTAFGGEMPDRCPACFSGRLITVTSGTATNRFCPECVLCWHTDGSSIGAVDPWSCPGCELGNARCFERWQREGYWEPPDIGRLERRSSR